MGKVVVVVGIILRFPLTMETTEGCLIKDVAVAADDDDPGVIRHVVGVVDDVEEEDVEDGAVICVVRI